MTMNMITNMNMNMIMITNDKAASHEPRAMSHEA